MFDICKHTNIIDYYKQMNTCITLHGYPLWEAHLKYSKIFFFVYDTMLLTIVLILPITYPDLVSYITASLFTNLMAFMKKNNYIHPPKSWILQFACFSNYSTEKNYKTFLLVLQK